MNKNTLFAFILILGTIAFFQSPLYYKYVLHKPFPADVAREKKMQAQQAAVEDSLQQQKDTATSAVAEKSTEDTTTSRDTVEQQVAAPATPSDTVWVETNYLIVGVSEKGGLITSARTKDYRYDPTEEGGALIQLVERENAGGGNLNINGENLDNLHFESNSAAGKISVEGDEHKSVMFSATTPSGMQIRKVYTFYGNEYRIGLRVESGRLDGKKVGVGWKAGIRESEESSGGRMARYNVSRIHLYDGKNTENITDKKPQVQDRTGYYKWIGLTSKYFLIALVPDSVRDADIQISSFEVKDTAAGKDEKQNTSMNYGFMYESFASGQSESFDLYVGPAQLTRLKEWNIGLQKVLFGGWKVFFWANVWFPPLCEFVLNLLIQLQKIVRDYGVVIVLLTILLKVVTYPLTQSSMKSMSRMKDMQPKINAIREKYKNQPKKMNEKLMAMYKEEGVNPLNPGCLPMFLQMPIFISLFVVLRKSIELRGADTFLVPWVSDLSQPEVLFSLPFNVPFYGTNVALLPIVMAVLTFFQNKATIKDPNQKAMIYFMPVMMLVLFNNFPAGLVLYWTFSSALQLVQQRLIDRSKR